MHLNRFIKVSLRPSLSGQWFLLIANLDIVYSSDNKSCHPHQTISLDYVLAGICKFSYTVKNIRRFYGKITGNQLPVHFPLSFTGARKPFQESGTER